MSLAIDMARRRASGFGAFEPGWDDALGPPPPPDPSWGIDRVVINSDIPWYVSGAPVFGVIGKTLSNIFGNQYQQPTNTAALQQYRQQQQQYQVLPPGYGYDSSGRLVKQSLGNVTDFISNNPLLVGAVVIGGILLFMRPPGRR